MIVYAIRCNKCHDIIYSRAVHDFHYCSCETVAIDGGFDYTRVLGNQSDYTDIPILKIKATKKQLYNDWNTRENEYGWINWKEQIRLGLTEFGMKIFNFKIKQKNSSIKTIKIKCVCGKKFKCNSNVEIIQCPKCKRIDNLNLIIKELNHETAQSFKNRTN